MLDPKLFILEKEYDQNCQTKIVPAFNSLTDSNMTIVPWVEPDFWDNVSCEKFAQEFCQQILDRLQFLTTPMKGGKEKVNYTPEIAACLNTLLHLAVTYKYTFPKESWNRAYERLMAVEINQISYSLVHISKVFQTNLANMKPILDNITSKYENKHFLSTLPIFNLLGLIRLVRKDPKTLSNIFDAFKARLDSLNVISEAVTLIHILRLFITIFPGISKDLLGSLIVPLQSSLVYPIPVSSMGADLGMMIERERIYTGAAFYDMMKQIASTNIATNGVVPLLFDQCVRFFPNFLHNRNPSDYSFERTLFNFGNFYLSENFHENPRSPKHIFKIVKSLSFTKKDTVKLMKKFKLRGYKQYLSDGEGSEQEEEEEEEEKFQKFDPSNLKPPTVNFHPIKLSVNFTLNPNLVTDFVDYTRYFMTPTSAIFDTMIIKPIVKYAQERDTKDIFEYKMAVCGDDFFFSNVVSSFILSLAMKKEELSTMSHMFYLIPLDRQTPSELADYIASYDETYSRFVNNVYSVVSNMAPVFNEESIATFPLIVGESKENNVWYANPSPSTILQFAMQHYVQFAGFSCDCYLWSAVLEYEENVITVPFLTSLHIGTQFSSGRFVVQSEKKIKSRKFSIVTNTEAAEKIVDLTSLVFWNVNVKERIRPNDRDLMFETVNDITNSDVQHMREILGDKITRLPIRRASIKSADKVPQPFKVFIDQRYYGSVKSVKIMPMPSFVGYENQSKIRIATFVPFE